MRPQGQEADREARRLIGLLRRLVRLSNRSLRSMEDELGLGSSALSKILNGGIRPQLGTVLLLAETLGMTPAQFFQLAYREKAPIHPLAQQMMEAEGIPVEEEAAPAVVKEQVREVLYELLADLLKSKP